jgi:hypothetical protein
MHKEKEVKGKERKQTHQRPEGKMMRSLLNSTYGRFDGALLAGDEKKNKITTSFPASPVNIAAFGFLVVILFFFSLMGYAHAETAAPGWEATTDSYPTSLSPGGTGQIFIDVYNVGAVYSNGKVTVTDVLPAGLKATGASEVDNLDIPHATVWHCTIGGEGKLEDRVVTCTTTTPILPGEIAGALDQGATEQDRLAIAVEAEHDAVTGANHVSIVGGGASLPASVTKPVLVGSSSSGFGFADVDGWATNADGTLDTQAGSHPYELTFFFDMSFENADGSDGNIRDLNVNAPPGIVGDPTAVPRCSRQAFDEEECPAATQVGIDFPVLLGGGTSTSTSTVDIPVYNLVPPQGIPAQFGFVILGSHTFLDAGVRTGGDNGITEHVDNITEDHQVIGNSITLWGVPAEASHNDERCAGDGAPNCGEASGDPFGASSDAEPKPFLTLPTSCGEPLRWTVETNSWQEAGNIAKSGYVTHDEEGNPAGYTGCGKLVHFTPGIAIAPDTTFSDTPAGLGVEVRMPPDSNPEGLASSGLKDTTVTLPEGVVINPGQATGLQACQPSQEALGDEPNGEVNEGPPSCPAASKVGTVEISTPLLEEKLVGNVYVLQSNPPHLQLLIAALAEGVNLKLLANVHLDEQTGRLTTTVEETPDLPFTTFKLNFSGGAQAALATPVDCGTYSSNALFMPWSSPFIQSFPTGSSFEVASGPGGGACPSTPLPFAPSLIAGATTDQAGGFTGFSMLLQSGDGQQRIEKLQFKAPPGLSGMISQVPLCPEPQAAQGTCSAASQIGHSIVASGPGPYPLVLPQAGAPESPIFLTGPYEGAPFGLTIVTHVLAGPFDLGTVITRAKIEINPTTAQITVTTDPLPQIIAGVPTDLRTVDAVIDRPGFIFNPTNCSPSSFSGTAWGTPPPGAGGAGATAAIDSHFQVGSCQSLKFEPKFTAATSGKTSKSQGASLTLKVQRASGPSSQQANFTEAKIELPKQLPSRLTTLQKACTAAQFNANPAGCPAASVIGHVKVVTPILPVPLEGPAYFVSHGGEAFPSVTVVLQGDGVTIVVVSTTFISKSGITSATIKTVPDQPFTSFELTFPQGPYSALAANADLCKPTHAVTTKKTVTEKVKGKTKKVTKKTTKQVAESLKMPTEFIAQNGLEIHQSTPITVTGCPKQRAAKAKKRAKGKGKKGKQK